MSASGGGPKIDELTLRPVADADRELLFRLYASTRTEELALAPWTAQDKEQFLREQFRLQDQHYRRLYSHGRFDLVLHQGEVVGRLYVAPDEGMLLIVDIALFPEYRGQGLGARLIRNVLEEAAQTATPVRVHVLPHNRARALYRRLGFEKIGDAGLHELMQWRPPA